MFGIFHLDYNMITMSQSSIANKIKSSFVGINTAWYFALPGADFLITIC